MRVKSWCVHGGRNPRREEHEEATGEQWTIERREYDICGV